MEKDETGKNLLQTLTDHTGKFPARADEREREPVEVIESNREEQVGKRPEEVVVEHKAAPEKGKAVEPRKYKVRIDDGSGETVVKELTAQEMQEQGLLDKLVTTASQFPAVQKKYQELLEQTAEGKKPEKVTKAEDTPKPVAPTAEQILTIYTPIIKALVEKGYYEPDFVEAYPLEAALIAYQWDQNIDLAKKVAALSNWVLGEIRDRTISKVDETLENAIEEVAVKGDGEKGDPLYRDLRDIETRVAFKAWVKKEVDPKLETITAENMEKFWFAFNAKKILEVTKQATQKAVEPVSKRKAAGDGSPSRPGLRESPKEKGLLDRMTDHRLGAEA